MPPLLCYAIPFSLPFFAWIWNLCDFHWFRRAIAEFSDEIAKPAKSVVPSKFNSSNQVVLANSEELAADNVDRIKSAISVVQEIAQKRELSIRFVVESETGPAHMKHFIIKCTVGEIEVSIAQNSECLVTF